MADGAIQQNPPNPIPPVESGGASQGSVSQGSQSTGTPQTPSTPDWVSYIPEQHRSNPKAYFDQIEEMRSWSDYGRKISPFHRQFESVQQDWENYQNWKRSQQNQQRSQTREPASQSTPEHEPEINWDDDPDAARKAYQRQQQAIQSHVQQFTERMDQIAQQQEIGQKTIMEVFRIRSDMEALQRRDPNVNPRELAEFMVKENINDVERAYDLMYRPKTWDSEKQALEAAAQQRYEQGKADAERELASRRVTTETSVGTPWRMRTEGRSKTPANSRDRRQEILDKIASKVGAPREYAE